MSEASANFENKVSKRKASTASSSSSKPHGSQGSTKRRRHSDGREKRPGKRRKSRPTLTAFEVFHGGRGDISDPLNLNCDDQDQDACDSQSAEEEGDVSAVLDEVQNSELPRNSEDPLNLLADARKAANKERKKRIRKLALLRREERRKQSTGDEEEKSDRLIRRRKSRRKSSRDGESTADEAGGKPAKRKRRHRRASSSQDGNSSDDMAEHNFRPHDSRFRYGNYSRYYGYRNPSGVADERLKCIPKSLFKDKFCLDIGCNVGHVTLCIARDSAPRRIVGIDIDSSLIQGAESNLRHYVVPSKDGSYKSFSTLQQNFPVSFKLAYGPLASPFLRPPSQPVAGKGFPLNISFREENYLVDSMENACAQKPEHDTILALSITKWIHLNWGDDGIQRFFHRMYHHLRPGGSLVLEPQTWSSYNRKSKTMSTLRANYHAIKLTPEQFEDYLVNQVGFVSMESLPTPRAEVQGFQRPLYVFSKSSSSDSYCNLCRPQEVIAAKKKPKLKHAVRLSTELS